MNLMHTGAQLHVFDQQRATKVSELYTSTSGGRIAPIDGGTREDLIFLRVETDDEGMLVSPDPAYGLPTARQAPLAAAIGVRARF